MINFIWSEKRKTRDLEFIKFDERNWQHSREVNMRIPCQWLYSTSLVDHLSHWTWHWLIVENFHRENFVQYRNQNARKRTIHIELPTARFFITMESRKRLCSFASLSISMAIWKRQIIRCAMEEIVVDEHFSVEILSLLIRQHVDHCHVLQYPLPTQLVQSRLHNWFSWPWLALNWRRNKTYRAYDQMRDFINIVEHMCSFDLFGEKKLRGRFLLDRWWQLWCIGRLEVAFARFEYSQTTRDHVYKLERCSFFHASRFLLQRKKERNSF